MPISLDDTSQTFHLQTRNMSYGFLVTPEGQLAHLYWGPKVQHVSLAYILQTRQDTFGGDIISTIPPRWVMPYEYPGGGRGDFGSSAYEIQHHDGSRISEFLYTGYRRVHGKPRIPGLPATYTEADEEAETLHVECRDVVSNVHITLNYTVYRDLDVITRSVVFKNMGSQPCHILRGLSASVDLLGITDWDWVALEGAWGGERFVTRRPLHVGSQSIGSARGMSGHQWNPFLALAEPTASEDSGHVYGFQLVYSGNFMMQAEIEPTRDVARILLGINPSGFSWQLGVHETFHTPEAILSFSEQGLGGLSRTLHQLYRTRLVRGPHRDRERPILVNSWEGFYFSVNEKNILDLAQATKDIGAELVVIDDGWFGRRHDDQCSLGDWAEDSEKFPHGLRSVANQIHGMGLKFGLWMEPEMISPNSALYSEHPDWCFHGPDRNPILWRHQLTLDLSRSDVCEYVLQAVTRVLESAPIDYVKWDMNRPMTDLFSVSWASHHQGEIAHRYMLGLYQILETLVQKFPHILFENCASGGGRFDPGMLYYMPQTWTSDNTDALSRLFIQYGTSLAYPPLSIGAHVSAVPNQQMNRITPWEFRGHVAMSGNFGYELDLTKLSSEERQVLRNQVALYKSLRPLVQFGDFYRLQSPWNGEAAAWMFVSPTKNRAVVFYFQMIPHRPMLLPRILKLRGLDPNQHYVLTQTGECLTGDVLMHVGVPLPAMHGLIHVGVPLAAMHGDYRSALLELRRQE